MTGVRPPAVDREVVSTLAALSRGATLDDAGAEVLAGFATDSVREGSRLQLEVLAGHLAAGETVGGWKVGWTSRGARTEAGASGDRPFGYVLGSRVLESGAVLDLGQIPGCKLEPEIALVLASPLGGEQVSRDDARAAVGAVAPAFEICSSRLRPGMSLGVRVGNALNNWGIVVGEHVPVDATDLAAVELSMVGDGQVVARGSSGPDVLDDPFTSLATVATYLHGFGQRLEAGHVLITGSLCTPVPVVAGTRYEAIFDGLGSVSVSC